jgi:L-lactate dehydrogenase complex protein LldF
VCPVKIDIPSVLLHLRKRAVDAGLDAGEGAAFRLAARAMSGRRRFVLAEHLARLGFALRRLPGPLRAWTGTRDLKAPAGASFRDWWQQR